MPTLYRKYRPQTFADLIGQEHIAKTIENEITLGRLAHAYLFSGPRGVGKTTLARLLAKAVNCERRKQDSFEPCDECASCREISAGRNMDVFEMDAASHTQVEKVRENILETINFGPTKSKYKIFIIDEAHMLSGASFNALLKTLEEPPAHVIFILATTELTKLPATVVSRCERYTFKKIPADLMRERLQKLTEAEGVKLDREVMARLITVSDGCLRDAESILGQIISSGKKKISLEEAALILPPSYAAELMEFSAAALSGNAAEALLQLAKLAEAGVNFAYLTEELLGFWRTLALLAATSNEALWSDWSPDLQKRGRALISALAPKRWQYALDALLARLPQLKISPLPELPLELLAIELSLDKDAAPTTESKSSAPVISPLPTQKIAGLKHTASRATLEQLRADWDNIVVAVAGANPSLTFILKMCALTELSAEGLELTVPYKIHQEKLREPKTKKLLEDALLAKYGTPIAIHCRVNQDKEEPVRAADLSALALEFGGEVVG